VNAARVACVVMAVPQAVVVALLLVWGHPMHAMSVAALLALQIAMMPRFLASPVERATWYSAIGINFYVLGMLISAFALRAATNFGGTA
jgi:chlorophyll/bacteriochlorophyll a synthase